MNAEQAYLFRHALLRDAAYHLQPPAERGRLHALAFYLVEAAFGGRPPELPALVDHGVPHPHRTDVVAAELAHHAGLGYEGSENPELRRLQSDYLRRAAEHAERRFHHRTACRLWQDLAALLNGAYAAEALRRAGGAAEVLGSIHEAESLLERALSLAVHATHRRTEARVLCDLANHYRNTGRPSEAANRFERALQIARAIGDRRIEGAALGNSAILAKHLGQHERAVQLFEQALALVREVGNRNGEGTVLDHLGTLHRRARRYEAAQEMHERALAIQREIGARQFEGVALGNLAILYRYMGRHEQAQAFIRQSLAILREVGDRRSEGTALLNLATQHHTDGDLGQAEPAYYAALAILREVGDSLAEATTMANLAKLYHTSGRDSAAESAYTWVIESLRKLGSRSLLGGQICDFALMKLELGRVEEARAEWQAGRQILAELNNPQDTTTAIAEMREVCAKAGVPAFDS